MKVGYTGFYGVKWGNSDVYVKCTALVASRNGRIRRRPRVQNKMNNRLDK